MLSEITHLKDVALSYIQKGGNADGIPLPVQKFLNENVNEYKIEQFLQHEDVVTAIKNTVPRVWELLWSTAGIIINFAASLIGLLYLLFLLTDYEKYANSWITFVPPSKRPFATRFVADVERCMAGYFRGQALIALSNCVMFSIGFAIVDFPLPIALGCLIGVISFVPYLQLVGVVPAALPALLKAVETGQNFGACSASLPWFTLWCRFCRTPFSHRASWATSWAFRRPSFCFRSRCGAMLSASWA